MSLKISELQELTLLGPDDFIEVSEDTGFGDYESKKLKLKAADIPNTPSGNIAATTVQAAINELDTEKAASILSDTVTSIEYKLSIENGILTRTEV